MRLYSTMGQSSAALRHYRELERLLHEELGVAPDALTQDLARQIEAQLRKRPDTQTAAASSYQSVVADTSDIAIESELRLFVTQARQPLLPLPGGTVTFLLIDVPGSTALRQQAEQDFTEALAKYQSLLRRAFRRHSGQIVGEAGDSFRVAFARASDTIAAAVEAQQNLAAREGLIKSGAINEPSLELRMALHTGETGLQETDYSGRAIDHAARLLSAAHAGQIICSEATAALLSRDLEPGLKLIELGVFRFQAMEIPERVFQIFYPGIAERDWPPLTAEPGYPTTLPLQLTRFFGREWELARLQLMLLKEGARLVTLIGPGGAGKTRLALELARRLIEPLGGAVWFVPLAELSDPQLIAGASLDSMRVDRAPTVDPIDQLAGALLGRPALLIFDNFEQLAGESARGSGAVIVQTLLERVATLKCLITSRRRLNIEGEYALPLLPLPVPERADAPERLIENESVRLFTDRAQATRPDFQVTKANAATVAELCRRLEGIPLGLELAAVRVQVLTPAQMVARFDERFELLLNRRRGVAERHRSLRAAIDWSYELLAPELQKCFAELSVFRGGWTLEAAEEVCEQPQALDCLTQLRECSLILADEDEFGMRFGMLETLRDYVKGRVEAERRAMLERRHAEFYLALAEQAEPELRSPRQAEWLKRLSLEYDNLRAALDWSKTSGGQIEIGLQVGCDIWRFWYARGHLSEGRKQLEEMLAIATERTSLRAKALNLAGGFAYYQGELSAAQALHEESLSIRQELGDRWGVASVLNNLAGVSSESGDYATARSLYEQGLAIKRELGDKWDIASSLLNLGTVAHYQGDIDAARSLYEESLTIMQELGDRLGIAHVLLNLGDVVRRQSGHLAARPIYEQSMAIYEELEHRNGIADCLDNLGKIHSEQGSYEQARSLYEKSLVIRDKVGNRQGIIQSLESLAALAHLEGKPEQSVRLFGAASALREALGMPLPPNVQTEYDTHIGELSGALGRAAFAAIWEAGRLLKQEQAVAYALGEVTPPLPGIGKKRRKR